MVLVPHYFITVVYTPPTGPAWPPVNIDITALVYANPGTTTQSWYEFYNTNGNQVTAQYNQDVDEPGTEPTPPGNGSGPVSWGCLITTCLVIGSIILGVGLGFVL